MYNLSQQVSKSINYIEKGEFMDTRKKVWIKPVLIVIGRGQPEETVLAACKTSQLNEIGPSRNKICTTAQANCEQQFNS